jgi:hypothetical protein
MPHSYIPDVKKILDDLSTDVELIFEERLILLAIVADYITRLTMKLEDELARETKGQGQ